MIDQISENKKSAPQLSDRGFFCRSSYFLASRVQVLLVTTSIARATDRIVYELVKASCGSVAHLGRYCTQ